MGYLDFWRAHLPVGCVIPAHLSNDERLPVFEWDSQNRRRPTDWLLLSALPPGPYDPADQRPWVSSGRVGMLCLEPLAGHGSESQQEPLGILEQACHLSQITTPFEETALVLLSGFWWKLSLSMGPESVNTSYLSELNF